MVAAEHDDREYQTTAEVTAAEIRRPNSSTLRRAMSMLMAEEYSEIAMRTRCTKHRN